MRFLKSTFSRLPVPVGASLKDKDVLLATWFGTGLIRPAPGTVGTLAALPFGYVIAALGGPIALFIAAVFVFGAGFWAAKHYTKKSGIEDDPSIVIDEAAGLFIAALPAGHNLLLWLVAFVLFRLFDVWKPWPVSWAERKFTGAMGVMVDDVLAGVYALFGVAIFSLFFMGQ